MSLDFMNFPSSINLTKKERQVNEDHVRKATARIKVVPPPERCPVCGKPDGDDSRHCKRCSCVFHTFHGKAWNGDDIE